MHLKCPHCHNPIELADLPDGGEITCAGCGSSFQLDKLATASFQRPEGKRIGKFEVLGTLGQGAFGIVYKARDTELDRFVAVKIPRAGNVGSGQDDVDRFLREARAVAQLRFPSIITVHEVGLDNGTPYLVSDFVEGVTLADMLTGRGFSFKESAKLLAEVADALQYAHSLGVVHRDVKPSNIMVVTDRPSLSASEGHDDDAAAALRWRSGSELKPVLMDFGLAKRDAGEITMTIDGQILGTPAYMSPEQARGDAHKVDGRSDVYSLGVILYQLLTNELPFRGNKAMLLHQVLHAEPKPPRGLNDKIPRDLETIALKAMAKEPVRRYGSAKQMADDLRRWSAGEAILARPIGSVERLWRWCKRKPALATANAAVLVAMVVFAGAFVVVSQSLDSEKAALDNEKKASKSAQEAATRNKELADEQTKLRVEADERREQAEELALQVGFNHFYSQSKENPALALVGTAQFLPKAAERRNRALFESMQLHIGGWNLAVHSLHWIGTHTDWVRVVALSADGKIAMSGSQDNTVRVWEVATGKSIGLPLRHAREICDVALSGDGKTVLTASLNGATQLWEAATGMPLGPPMPHLAVAGVALSRDGKIALTPSFGNRATLWATATGKPIGRPLQHEEHVIVGALSADGTTALTASLTGAVRLWETATAKPIGSPLKLEGVIQALALSADGKSAIAAGLSNTAWLWNGRTGKPIAPLPHRSLVGAVAVSADGRIAVTGCVDGTVRLWDTTTGIAIGSPINHQDAISSVAVSADSRIVLTGSKDRSVRMWDIGATKPVAPPMQELDRVVAVALSADGKTALTSNKNNTTSLWETTTSKPIGPPIQHDYTVHIVALSADGRTALTAGGANPARVWDAATGRPIGPAQKNEGNIGALALSADGTTAIRVPGEDHSAWLWDTGSGKPIGLPLQHDDAVVVVALSADGKIAMTASKDKNVRVWNSGTGILIGPALEHHNQLRCAALSADGAIALTAEDAFAKTIKLWETATGKGIGKPLNYDGVLFSLALNANGKVALTGSYTGEVQFWETDTGKRIGPALQHRRHAPMALSADGKTAVTGSLLDKIRIWKLPRLTEDPERILLWAQVITGIEADEHGNARALSADEWQRRKARLDKLGGPPVLD